MLSSGASKSAIVRQVNQMGGPSGPGFIGSGGSTGIIQHDDFGPSRPITGVITNNGPYGTEGDQVGAQYWVQLTNNYIVDGTNDENGQLLNMQNATSTFDTNQQSVKRIVSAYNLSEVSAVSHMLTVGTPVLIQALYIDMPGDNKATPQLRWFILGSAATSIKFVSLTGTTAVAGNMSGGALGAGYYSGALAILPSSPIDPSGTFGDAGIGSSPTLCYAINPYEQIVGARFLDTTGTTVPVVFPVTLWGTSTAAYGSLPVYRMIGSIQGVPLCSTGGAVGGN